MCLNFSNLTSLPCFHTFFQLHHDHHQPYITLNFFRNVLLLYNLKMPLLLYTRWLVCIGRTVKYSMLLPVRTLRLVRSSFKGLGFSPFFMPVTVSASRSEPASLPTHWSAFLPSSLPPCTCHFKHATHRWVLGVSSFLRGNQTDLTCQPLHPPFSPATPTQSKASTPVKVEPTDKNSLCTNLLHHLASPTHWNNIQICQQKAEYN